MNTDPIEKLLRQAPPVRTPAGLLEELQAAIELPRASSITQTPDLRPQTQSSLRRWLPALGFALWFLGCVVVFGLQASRMAELRERHRALESARVVAAQQVLAAEAANATLAAELERLKRDFADVQRLRVEIEQLRVETQELTALRAQNQQLRTELKSQAPPAKPKEDFFAGEAGRPARIKCINNLKQVGLSARLWANDHNDVLPPNFEAMKEELVTDKPTFCPADGTTRYEILSPGVGTTDPRIVYVRCPMHNNVGFADGSAAMLDEHKLVQRDGKWMIER